MDKFCTMKSRVTLLLLIFITILLTFTHCDVQSKKKSTSGEKKNKSNSKKSTKVDGQTRTPIDRKPLSDGLINGEVLREIDASKAVVRLSIDIIVKNIRSEVDREYRLIFPNPQSVRLAYLSVSTSEGQQLETFSPQSFAAGGNFTAYDVPLPHASNEKEGSSKSLSSSEVKLKVKAVFTGVLKPYPAEIRQEASQLVQLFDDHYFLSPYRTETQKTLVKLSEGTIESYTKLEPQSVKGSTITFGPYKEVMPLQSSPLVVHSTNNQPFARFSEMSREVEVSHWGNIFIEEIYELQHVGAKLKGGFSRFDYQSNKYRRSPSFTTLKGSLPKEAKNIYYRDQIGNISSSALSYRKDRINMEVSTRFPMFGGWKTQFYIGYSVPTESALSREVTGDRHKLKVDFFTIFEDVWVEELELKVILPEGCQDIKVDVPYPVTEHRGRRFTYLDSELNGGRPVITLRAKNAVEEHSRDKITISYTFARSRMVVEPLMLVAAFFLFFTACVAFSRVDSFYGVNPFGKKKEIRKEV